jgi:hypothetical protein
VGDILQAITFALIIKIAGNSTKLFRERILNFTYKLRLELIKSISAVTNRVIVKI